MVRSKTHYAFIFMTDDKTTQRKPLVVLSKLLSVVCCIFVLMLAWIFFAPDIFQKERTVKNIYITPGTTFPKIVQLLDEHNLIQSKRGFWLTAKVFGKSGKLQAGKYSISTGLSNFALLTTLSRGKVTAEWVTIPEGTRTFGIASLLSRSVGVDSSEFIELTKDSSLIAGIAPGAPSLEGYLFPETYRLFWGISPRAAIEMMVQQFSEHLTDSLRTKMAELEMSLHDVITLASIIEGEASVDSERTIISAVYHNRLRKNMLLQACPTVQYIIPGHPRRLLNKDLEIDSPYNTYIYSGLPPGPVNNPGLASIQAALHPAAVEYLYFVAKGDGSHVFSRTMSAHLRAKNAFDQLRKELNRNL